LFESASLYVMPDKFPLLPGHILIISKAHLRCHAELPPEVEAELCDAAARVRRFLREAYGTEALAWENGVFGQTVAHAHLHLLPVSAGRFPWKQEAPSGLHCLGGWDEVRACFARHGGYRYMELAGEARLVVADAEALLAVRQWLVDVTGLRWEGGDWLRATTEEDVREVGRRWVSWRER
jgi:diadenosine tetraphosphate (Ap4A) HIT family hydrolase